MCSRSGAHGANRLEKIRDIRLAAVACPLEWRRVMVNVASIGARPAFDQQSHCIEMAAERSLMRRRSVRVYAESCIPVGIANGIQNHARSV